MNLHRREFARLPVLALLLCCMPSLVMAQDAKELFAKAQTPGLDQCTALLYACKAADMDPKKKDYRQACDGLRGALVDSDRGSLRKAHDAFDAKNYPQASRYAKYVCKNNVDQFAEAQSILSDVQHAQAPTVARNDPTPPQPPPAQNSKADQSTASYARAQTAYESGNFDVATTEANQVTDPNLKQLAGSILQNIARYRSAIGTGRQKEQTKDLEGAITAYQSALQINSHVPDGTAAHVQELQNQMRSLAQVKNPSTPPPNPTSQPKPGPAPPKPVAEDPAVVVARLLDGANRERAANHVNEALKGYDAVLRLQPNNADAVAGKNAMMDLQNKDPALQAQALIQAIKDFYVTKYSDAEDELSSYLSSTNVKSRGAAHFYLAATRLSRSLLDKPASPQSLQAALHNPDIQRLFKQSVGEQYKPVERYVSPLIMEAWRSANATQ